MSRSVRVWAAAAAAWIGLAAFLVWPPLAVFLTVVAVVATFYLSVQLNVLSSRVAFALAASAHAAAIFLGSGSSSLAAAAMIVMVAAPVYDSVAALGVGYAWHYALLAAWLVAGGISAVAWPGVWGLAVAPIMACGLAFFIAMTVVRRRLQRTAQHPWKVSEGDVVPDFELPNIGGEPFRMSERRGRHVLLMFLVGDWCPVCHVKLRIFQRAAPELKRHGLEVVAIWASNAAINESMKRELDLSFDLLADPECAVASRFGVVQPAGPGPAAPRPMSFLVGPDGRIVRGSRVDDLNSFLEPEAALKAVLAEATPAMATA